MLTTLTAVPLRIASRSTASPFASRPDGSTGRVYWIWSGRPCCLAHRSTRASARFLRSIPAELSRERSSTSMSRWVVPSDLITDSYAAASRFTLWQESAISVSAWSAL